MARKLDDGKYIKTHPNHFSFMFYHVEAHHMSVFEGLGFVMHHQ